MNSPLPWRLGSFAIDGEDYDAIVDASGKPVALEPTETRHYSAATGSVALGIGANTDEDFALIVERVNAAPAEVQVEQIAAWVAARVQAVYHSDPCAEVQEGINLAIEEIADGIRSGDWRPA